MSIIEELSKEFLKSKYFGPLNPSFIKVIEGYYNEQHLTLSNLADEMIRWGESVGVSINLQQEEKFLIEIVPKITLEVKSRLASGLINEKVVSDFAAYHGIFSFEDERFEAGLLSLLSDIEKCFDLHRMLENTQPLQLPSILEKYFSSKDDLIDVTNFSLLSKGFALKKDNIVVYPKLPLQLELHIFAFFRRNHRTVKLLIRPGRIGKFSNYSDMQRFQEAHIFGMPFTEQNLRGLIGKEHGVLEYFFENEVQEIRAKLSNVPLKGLQYVIKPLSDEHLTISIEEVMDIDKNNYRQFSRYSYSCCNDFYMLHRYAHTIINKKTLEISHFDCSYLYYDFDAYSERVDSHIKDKVVSASIKQKLFRIDGIIPFNDFKQILAACFDNDPEIVNLLKGS